MNDFFKHPEIKYEHLMGAPFIFGTNDCYELGRKVFAENTPIQLPPYARPNDFWLGVEDLYLNNFQREGFVQIDVPLNELQPLDVFLIAMPDNRQTSSRTITNHCAIYVGGNKVIHHYLNRASECVTYKGWVRQFTTHVIRHRDVPRLQPKSEDFDVMQMIPRHKRVKLMEALYGPQEERND